MTDAAKRIDWTAAPLVFVTAPVCPHCGGAKYTTQRSTNNGDTSRTKQAICSTCNTAFKIVTEFPEVGNGVMPVS